MGETNRKMEKDLNRPGKGESGQTSLIVVLALTILGAIIIIPILLFMNTGLKVTETHERRTEEFYAADSGVEDAIYKVRFNALPDWMQGTWDESTYSHEPYGYSIPQINGKDVAITIQPIWVLEGLENPKPAQRREPHDDLVTVGNIISAGTYQIVIIRSEDFPGQLKMDRIGCWLPAGFQYVSNSSNLEQDPNTPPVYKCVPSILPFRDGQAITWDYSPAIEYDNLTGELNRKVITFNFTSKDSNSNPQGSFTWTRTIRNDIYLSWDVNCKLYKITSTATDPVTGTSSTLTTYTNKDEFQKFGSGIAGDYQATGNTLMRDHNNDGYYRERLYQESPAQMTGIPSGASVEKILLYWSGWKNTPGNVWYESNPDISQWSVAHQQQLLNLVSTYKVNQVQLKVEAGASVFNQTITADPSQVQVLPNGNPSSPNGWSYSCCADVTNLVQGFFGSSFTGSANYIVGHVLNNLNGVWGSSSGNVFAMGDSGTILRYNGGTWSAMNSGTTNTLRGVWGSASNNIFAVGDSGTILRYNGSTWSAMNSGTTNNLNSIWGSASNNIFAVGDLGTILRYNGGTWSAMTSGTTNNLNSVWGSDSNNIFAVGDLGTILRYNGGTWSAMTSGTTNTLRGVWGTASNNVFAVGDSGTILRYTTSWSTKTSSTTNNLNSVWGTASNNVFAVGDSGTIRRSTDGSGSTWNAMSSATYSLYNWNGSHSGETPVSTTDYRLGDNSSSDEWAYAAWSVVVIYTSPQTKGHQLYLYDTFRYCDNGQTLTFQIKNFLAPGDVVSDPQAARITCFVGEGDECYGGGKYESTCWRDYGVHDWDCLKLNDWYLSDGTNPWNNVWNSKSNVLPSAANDGIDIDTFSAGDPIIKPADTQAKVEMPTGIDSWNLVYIILSFRSDVTTGGLLTYLVEAGG